MSGRGTRRERQVREQLLEPDGWVCIRAAGSHGPADIVALRANDRPKLVQVKSDQRGPYDNFGPVERTELVELARQAGADAWLCWWPPNRQPKWIPASAWP